MKILTTRLGLGLAAVLIGATVAGCASRSQNTETGSKTVPQLGAEMEKNGIMSQSNYVRQHTVAEAVRQTHTLSPADLTWTLGQLTEEKSSVARARAFNILADIRPMSAAQKSRILPAIAPYLTGSDRLDQLGALRVQKSAQAN